MSWKSTASSGVVVAFFQWGWGSDAIGLGKAGPIEAFLPPVTLAILFGMSMDYQVFLVSRMNEEWVHGRDSRRAVRTGLTQTARVITAAATIMICVFLAFALTGQRDIAEFGISLAAAVALDAFVLRTVLVPAAMHLFGDANWWLPRWKDRLLPHLAIEPPKGAPARTGPSSSPRRPGLWPSSWPSSSTGRRTVLPEARPEPSRHRRPAHPVKDSPPWTLAGSSLPPR